MLSNAIDCFNEYTYVRRLISILALDAISVSSQYQISDRLMVDL